MMVAICSREYGLNSTRFIDTRLMVRSDITRSGRSMVLEMPYLTRRPQRPR